MDDLNKMLHSTAGNTERTYGILHRHWFDLASRFMVIGLFLLLATYSAFFAIAYLHSVDDTTLVPVIYFVLSLLFLVTWVYSFFVWVDYFLDIWVITSARVVNIEQKGFFARNTSELDYAHIQDVTSEIQGIIQTLLNYGDVYVQTAGSQNKFMFRHVANPEKVKTLLTHISRQAISKTAHPEAIRKEVASHKQMHEEMDHAEGSTNGTASWERPIK